MASVSLAVTAPGTAWGAGYHSPGYKGNTSFKNVQPAPLAQMSLGTGKHPSLLVDAAGTAHIVYAQDGGAAAADTLVSCLLQRGIKTCASFKLAPNPQSPDPSAGGIFVGNFPAGNHDFDGPVPIVVGSQLHVIDRRFPNYFKTPDGGESDSNVFEWSSNDGGATLTGPGMIGTNQMAGGAIAYGDLRVPSIGTISRTQTAGTTFQGSLAGTYTTAKAQLGTGDQSYDGSLALDGRLPIAAFADNSGTVYVRKWSGVGNVNNAVTWSLASFPGETPRIVGGAAGVFVLYTNRGGGSEQLVRVVNGQPTGKPVKLNTSGSDPAVSEDPNGRIAYAYTDKKGIWVRTSTDGVEFSPPELVAAVKEGTSTLDPVVAATFDGGGFVAYVKDAKPPEGIGEIVLAAFGSQRATGKPGLGPLPGGGIGSSEGDQLATAQCEQVTFGVVVAKIDAGCFAHDPDNPNMNVTLGELDLNGIRIIPDPGVRIGIDFRQHTIDTTGKVRVVLTAFDFDITLWHDQIHAKVPTAEAGTDLFDFKKGDFGDFKPLVEDFPIEGDVDIKLTKNGVEVPISLKLPDYFGGVTGSSVLEATLNEGLKFKSVEFKVEDANLVAVELKDVDVSYTLDEDLWKGGATIWVPAGGDAFRASADVEFKDGKFNGGSIDIGLPYPGIPIDATNTPPQLFLTHGGLGFNLDPITLIGRTGFGLIPLSTPGKGGPDDYVFGLNGELTAAFGKPVTITAHVTGKLYKFDIGEGTLIYKIPDNVTFTGQAHFQFGFVRIEGKIGGIIDPDNKTFGALMRTEIRINPPDPFGGVDLPVMSIAVNTRGFGAFKALPGIYIPGIPPPTGGFFWGTIGYEWGADEPKIWPFRDMTGRFTSGVPIARSAGTKARRGAAAAGYGFTVPANAPSASVVVHGTTKAPLVTLTGPDGAQVPLNGQGTPNAMEVPSPTTNTTIIGIYKPRAGRWTIAAANGSPSPVTSLDFSIGVAPPKVTAKVTGRGFQRTVRYKATIPSNTVVTLAERSANLLHVIGRITDKSGTIPFRAALSPAGKRQLIAQIENDGIPKGDKVLATFVVPKPPRPGRARGLRVSAGKRSFSYSFVPPANATRVLVKIVGTDGRHLQKTVTPRFRGGSVPVIGFRDGITVTVIGLGVDGTRGPAVTAKARRPR